MTLRRVLSWETRKQRRGEASVETLRVAVGRTLADLVMATERGDRRWSYRQKDRNAFVGAMVPYLAWTTVFNALTDFGFLEAKIGYEDYKTGRRHATRLRATPALLGMFQAHGLLDHPRQHWGITAVTQPLRLQAASTRNGRHRVRGASIPFIHTPETERMRDDVLAFNEFMAPRIGGVPFEGATRLFIGGWNKHGRLYAAGEVNYKNITKAERRLLTLDDADTAEIDIRNSHLSILYALNGLPVPPGDLYDVTGVHRAVAKAWITVFLGAHRLVSRWPKRPLENLRDKGIYPQPYLSYKDPILRAHPVLEGWPGSSQDSGDLTFLEGNGVLGTSSRLIRQYGKPVLPIHDSLRVRTTDVDLASRVLRVEFERATGVRPELRTT